MSNARKITRSTTARKGKPAPKLTTASAATTTPTAPAWTRGRTIDELMLLGGRRGHRPRFAEIRAGVLEIARFVNKACDDALRALDNPFAPEAHTLAYTLDILTEEEGKLADLASDPTHAISHLRDAEAILSWGDDKPDACDGHKGVCGANVKRGETKCWHCLEEAKAAKVRS